MTIVAPEREGGKSRTFEQVPAEKIGFTASLQNTVNEPIDTLLSQLLERIGKKFPLQRMIKWNFEEIFLENKKKYIFKSCTLNE